jgi:hypothetical protein
MEVHHPHHPTHKKKWSEYITEFVMLFAAVTLGFFAENIREHQVIQHKTHQNLQSVVLDLKKDSTLIQERLNEYQKASALLGDLNNLYLKYQLNKISKNEYLNTALAIGDSLNFGTSFYINNSSYKNTIASGSFSNILSSELKRTISDYYEVYGAKLNDNNRILDDVVEYYNLNTFPKPSGHLPFDEKNKQHMDRKFLKEYFISKNLYNNSLLNINFIIYNQKAKDRVDIYLGLMKIYNEKNSELLKLLAEETK